MELTILHLIHSSLSSPVLDSVMMGITSLGNLGIVWLVVAGYLFAKPQYRVWGIALLFGLLLTSALGSMVLKPLIARPRPFTVNPSLLLPIMNAPKDFSMPSGHTAASFCAATILIQSKIQKPWKVVFTVLACLIAFSRLYLGVHYPSDVAVGVVLGVAIGWFTVYLFRHFDMLPDRNSESVHQ